LRTLRAVRGSLRSRTPLRQAPVIPVLSTAVKQFQSMPFSLIDLKHMHTLVSHPCISFTACSLILFIIGTFLLKNYKQALSLLDTKPAVIAALTKVGASSGEVVEEWLREEEAYLCGLSKEPLEETLEMEYYKMLESLRVTELVIDLLFFFFINNSF